ncbi:MAG: AhpC/TSA family protein [Alistipes sp.]|nr:AhpC/TSA family protein [Alistipes sp.]
MKRLFLAIFILLLLGACSRSVKFDIDGLLIENAASKVYLVVEGATIDTLASAKVGTDNKFCLRGEVAEPTTAFVCDDNGNALTILLLEEAQLYLRPIPTGGYIAEGGPINDTYNFVIQRLSDVAMQLAKLDYTTEYANEEYESLMFKYQDILSTAIRDNLDNLVGVELFLSQESRGMTAEDMRVRFAQFSPEMQSLSAMQRFAEYIDIYARTEIGNRFIDVELQAISGGISSLSDVCGKGNWVLVDFWATWCENYNRDIAMMRELYAKYTLQGFDICSISLDRDPNRWRTFIEQNDMLWTNAIDSVDDSKTSIAETYGLQTIPANFLISPEGVIVARNLYGEVLRHELEHIFGDCLCTDNAVKQQVANK